MKSLISLAVLAVFVISLIPMPISIIPSVLTTAQSSSEYDWAISAYSQNLTGANSYLVDFYNFSYFPMTNTNGINYMAEMINLPIQASGTIKTSVTTSDFSGIIVQLALIDFIGYGFYIEMNIGFTLNNGNTILVVFPLKSVNYNSGSQFIIEAGSTNGQWEATFQYSGGVVQYPDTPIPSNVTVPSNGLAGICYKSSGGTQNIIVYGISFTSVDSTSQELSLFGYPVYPSISLEVNAQSQNIFIQDLPKFVALFQLWKGNQEWDQPWNGQNLVSAQSNDNDLSEDSGAMIGASVPPSGVAWGAQEYIAKTSTHVEGRIEYITNYYDVDYWMLGTQNGIDSYASVNNIVVNGYANPFISLVTSYQQEIAVPSGTTTVLL
ncbi:hypothetical protein [Acidianus brierleyi]|uniref:Uncharacterized protein n=1 Tax=Acidianus brierleyi TaxID=41673 RepID=A0A2U9IHH6_9CREN|nr:hypothetical protein [Acidianus brierleyi]AWR95436.1 hypothetical protein DFR85_13380 [Acidianus brierleyi]